jgi:hypothetical protein
MSEDTPFNVCDGIRFILHSDLHTYNLYKTILIEKCQQYIEGGISFTKFNVLAILLHLFRSNEFLVISFHILNIIGRFDAVEFSREKRSFRPHD